MPELLLELFSEEIPARMQARAAEDLSRLTADALASLSPANLRSFHGPRRVALAANVASAVPESSTVERGPRANAPEQAMAGFLRKHGARREQLAREGDYWILRKITPAQDSASVIAAALPPLLRRFPWPKSMRWGGTSGFTWVRPLRRVLCLLDGDVIRFELSDSADDAHGLQSGNETEGHRFLAPGAVAVFGMNDWASRLRERYVIVDAVERRNTILAGVRSQTEARGLQVVEDAALLDEVAGLVEWPVPLLGRIDDAFMDLPPEVMQVSMRVNQRYFALRYPDGSPAPWFAFVANIEAPDGGAAIIAGNERVLRARFADARHFWDLDRKVPLESRVPALDAITFHAKLGSQGDRVRRLEKLAGEIAQERSIGADVNRVRRAAKLAKADLTAGMVGEFPELQGIMGSYYAEEDREHPEVVAAIRDHYAPRGPTDKVPSHPVSIAVALADKLDLLASFFAIGEKPTGSSDPYALRRAALGVVRIVRENNLHPLKLARLIAAAVPSQQVDSIPSDVLSFVVERLRIQLRAEGAPHDVVAAVFAIQTPEEWHDDLILLLSRSEALATLLGGQDGADLLTAYRRAANILRIEDKKDGPHRGQPDEALFVTDEEMNLFRTLEQVGDSVQRLLTSSHFAAAMREMATLRPPVDAFFHKVTVNAPEPELRRNRLRLLAQLRDTMNRVADFSKIEG